MAHLPIIMLNLWQANAPTHKKNASVQMDLKKLQQIALILKHGSLSKDLSLMFWTSERRLKAILNVNAASAFCLTNNTEVFSAHMHCINQFNPLHTF